MANLTGIIVFGLSLNSCLFFFSDTMTCNSKPMKPNGKIETSVEEASSPPRTTLLGTIFSPVFNFFSPATKTGKTSCLYLTESFCYSQNVPTALVICTQLLLVQTLLARRWRQRRSWNSWTLSRQKKCQAALLHPQRASLHVTLPQCYHRGFRSPVIQP